MAETRPVPLAAYGVIAACLVLLQAILVHAQGHPLICTCGTVKLWGGGPDNPENSQQIFDWYSVTHILHGFLFYLILFLVARRQPIGARLALAVAFEAGWEVLENAPIIVERYRQTALAQGYFGDSVLNSVSDTLVATAGFVLTGLLPPWFTLALAIGLELFLAVVIRDNLTLNILDLVYPIDAVSRWQAGG